MTSQIQQDLDQNNAQYAANFTSGHLALPPAKKYLVLTCMDARIDPAAALGIPIGDAHIIRNAGASARDALRSILISQHMLGTREIVLIKHSGCGMLTFSNEDGRAAVEANGSKLEAGFDFLPFGDLEEAVRADVGFLRAEEGLVGGTVVSGWVYDVGSGRIGRVL